MATPSPAASSSGPWGSTVKISVGSGSLHASRDHGEAAVPVPGDGDGEGRGGRPAKKPSRAADPPLEPEVARAFLAPPLERAKPPASPPADVGVDGVADPRKTRDPRDP